MTRSSSCPGWAVPAAATNVAELANREVAELSGGQRQRLWAAMGLLS
ncbi:hypothetical protein [Micropruina sp.]